MAMWISFYLGFACTYNVLVYPPFLEVRIPEFICFVWVS